MPLAVTLFLQRPDVRHAIWDFTHVALPTYLIFFPTATLVFATVYPGNAISSTLRAMTGMDSARLNAAIFRHVRGFLIYVMARAVIHDTLGVVGGAVGEYLERRLLN